MDFLLGIMFGVLAMCLAVWFFLMWVRHTLEKILTTAASAVEKSDEVRARVEEHSGIFYFYNSETNEFLGQGSTLNELVDRLGKPDISIIVHQGEPEVLARLRTILNQKVQDA